MRNVWRVLATRNRLVVLAILAAVLVGCVSGRGIQEFTLYQAAFDKSHATANMILDQLAVQERNLFQAEYGLGPRSRAAEFNPEFARYYTDSVDPPGTAAFRRSMATVKSYNDLLFGLASGQTSQALTAKLGELQVNLSRSLNEVGKLAAIPQLAALSGTLNAAFGQMQPFVELALRRRSRQAFRAYLVQTSPIVMTILLELREGTKDIFPVLTAATTMRARSTLSALTVEELAKLEGYQKLLADWVVLLDGTIVALQQADAALRAGPTLAGAAGNLGTMALELTAASEAARKHMADLAAQ